MILDEIDIKIIKENFSNELIHQMDYENVNKILNYLYYNGVYYAKDLLVSSMDLFLLSYEEFISRFEKLKENLGDNYVSKLGENTLLIELMY